MTAMQIRVGLALILAGGAAFCGGLVAINAAEDNAQPKGESAQVAFAGQLPALKGEHLKVTVVEVTYGPGASSKPHTHTCPVIGYVLAGTLRTQAQGQPMVTYKSGESFYEAPNAVHRISANASDKEAARFLAFFVCDHDGPRSVQLREASPQERNDHE